MGQAKTRGTFEQRRAAAVEREQKAKAEQLERERSRAAIEVRTPKERRPVNVGSGHMSRHDAKLLIAALMGMTYSR